MSNFHNDLTVNKSEIEFLLRQVLGLCGKGEGYYRKGISITSNIFFSKFPTVRMFGYEFQTCCLNFTTIQRLMSLRSSFYIDMFECMRKKREGFGRKRMENEIER